MMERYIGTKVLLAQPMTRAEYCAKRGWDVPVDEDGSDEGFLVEYEDGGEPNLAGHAGYVSWSPANVFHRSYRLTRGLTFGQALEALKIGKRVAREGWNGKGMFAYLVPANSYPVQTGAAAAHFGKGSMVPYRAYLALKTVDDDVATWAPSCSDVLAEDWTVLEEDA